MHIMANVDMRAMSSMDPKRIERHQQEVCSTSRTSGQGHHEGTSFGGQRERRSSAKELNDVSSSDNIHDGSDFENREGSGGAIVQPEPVRPMWRPTTGNCSSSEVEETGGSANARRSLEARIIEWQRQHSVQRLDVPAVLRELADDWRENDASVDATTFDNFLHGISEALDSSFAENYRRLSLASVSSRKLQEISGQNDGDVVCICTFCHCDGY